MSLIQNACLKSVKGLLLLLAVSAGSPAWGECKATVDMADSLDFRRLHDQCDQDKSLQEQTGALAPAKDNETGRVPESGSTAESATDGSQTRSEAGVRLRVGEPFSITGGPESAQRGLFAQMAARCPQGWTKWSEWTEANGQSYMLYVEFSCRS